MNEGYMDLLAAIYKTAVVDDSRGVAQLALIPVSEVFKLKGAPEYVGSAPKILKAHRTKAKKYIKSKRDYIQNQVKQNVAKEAPEWGSGKTRKMQADGVAAVVDKLVKICKEECDATT